MQRWAGKYLLYLLVLTPLNGVKVKNNKKGIKRYRTQKKQSDSYQ